MAPDTPPRTTPPQIADLMTRFLARQAEARNAGILETPVNEVEPYEAAAFPLVDPRTAWDETTVALRMLDPEKARASVSPPADWSAVVAGLDSVAAVSFAAGNFPQMVRDLPTLIRAAPRSELLPKPALPLAASSLESWATQTARKSQFPQTILAIGLLRVSRQFESADAMINDLRPHMPERWQPAFANEEAALAWHRGDTDAAAARWNSLPDSAPVLFNRGMSLLFRDQPAEARDALRQATLLLPEDSAWHHLARLYLALAGM